MTPAGIGTLYSVNKNTIRNGMLESGHELRGPRDVHRVHKLNTGAFTEESEEVQYWIGFAMADGWVRDKEGTFCVALQLADISHLRKLHTFLKSSTEIKTGTLNRGAYKPGAQFARITVHSKDLVDSLMAAGVVPNKTGREELLKFQMSRHTWRGAIDGDGSVGWHTRGYFYIKLYGCKIFCEQFRLYVLTIVPKCRAKVQKSKSIFSFALCCGPAEAVARELYRE